MTTNAPEDGQNVPKDEKSFTPAGERERLLAAIGWEGDPRRRKVLRRLLQEQCQRIYLHCYAATHNRHSAMDGARRALLGTARTLDQVPEACPLSIWVFLQLRLAPERAPECPEPWRILADLNREGADPIERHGEAHPGCADLTAAYRSFLNMPMDTALGSRAGWPAPIVDLDRFLEAQFGDENPQAVRPIDYWRQLLRSFRWSRSGLAGALIVVAALVLAVILLTEWQDRIFPRRDREVNTASTTPKATPSGVIKSSGPELALISGASITIEKANLAFQWTPASNTQQYRLLILTAKLDSLYRVDQLATCSARIARRDINGLNPGGSYLFRVDGLKNGAVVASSGYQPFDLPQP